MITYRKLSFENDIQEVVELININLNQRHTVNFMRWKHLENPNGKSIGAVAVKNYKIIGVVFYLPTYFETSSGTKVRCLRPVDGCTAKKERGQGVFKELMKYCLSLFKNQYDLLLANPNKYSYPEFLKLNWKTPEDNYYYNLGILSPSLKSVSKKITDFKNVNFKKKLK